MSRIDFDALRECAESLGTGFHDHEKAEIERIAEWMTATLDAFEEQARPLLPEPVAVSATRKIGTSPSLEEDPLNAIIRRVDVFANRDEITSDILKDKRVALKDLISVAGVPFSLASTVFDGVIPIEDAVVTERVLRAGGRIVAMTNLENMAFGAGGESGDYGPIKNPVDQTRSASGSSAGSAAALFYDDIDIAFGTDQGGSVRLPASWCGVLGLKPTHGLVPYTGIASHDQTFDHVGPMTRTTADMALAMTAVSGPDWSDPRQTGTPAEPLPYGTVVEQASDSFKGVSFGVLREALLSDGSEEREGALAAFRDTINKVRELGGEVSEISIPAHTIGPSLLFAGLAEGIMSALHGNGEGYHWSGRHSAHMRRQIGKSMASRGKELQPAYKTTAAIGEYLRRHRFGEMYAMAQTVIPSLRRSYDEALSRVDCIIMPTTPTAAMKLDPSASLFEREFRSFSPAVDTPAHNATGHPALSMPAASVNGLPLGVMLVGRRFTDHSLLGFARTWERHYGWHPQVSS